MKRNIICMFMIVVVLSAKYGIADEEEKAGINSLLNKTISQDEAKKLPSKDCTTLEKAFLGYLKSQMEGKVKDFSFYLTPQAMQDFVGINKEDEITESEAHRIEDATTKKKWKLKLESFKLIPNESSPKQIEAVFSSKSETSKGEKREKALIDVIQINGQWKFTKISYEALSNATE
jgi:hypothetical protein